MTSSVAATTPRVRTFAPVALPTRQDAPRAHDTDAIEDRLPRAVRLLPPAAEPPSDAWYARVGRSLRRGSIDLQYATLRHLMHRRLMTTYGADSGWSDAARAHALEQFARQLDFHSNGVTFRDELRELSRTPGVERYLADLEAHLIDAGEGQPFSLFALTEHHAGSADEAMRWIAVLLQDVRLRTATDDYYEGEVPETLTPSFRRLMALFQRPSVIANVDPYPPGVMCRDQAFYHYYVPAHLARRMRDAGVHPELAAATATIFNAEYELNQHVASQGGGIVARIDFVQHGVANGFGMHERSVQQIRAGYQGAMRAVGLPSDPETLTRSPLERPRLAFRQLLRDAYVRSTAQ